MKNAVKLLLGVLLLVAVACPAFADWGVSVGVGDRHDHHDHWDHDRRYYGWHDRPAWGYHAHYLPIGYSTIWVGGTRYYYSDGLYYNYVGDGDYVIVNPPMGAYVAAIPPDFQPIIVNGRTYYTNGGVYYLLTMHHGYKVVPPPMQTVVVTEPAVVQPTVVEPPPVQDAYPVNVPASNGSYVSVVLKRSGSGYVGPQGEYYATFPSVAQLKAMYGK
jgi:hypothetical protein